MRQTTIRIAAPAEVVWDLVTDITRTGEWCPENVGGMWLDGGSGPVPGARFKGRNKRRGSWSTTCTVVAAERGRSFVFDVGKGETRWAYRFDLEPGGCLVTESFDVVRAPGWFGRWMTKLGTGVTWDEREADLMRGMEETLRRLKATAESIGAELGADDHSGAVRQLRS